MRYLQLQRHEKVVLDNQIDQLFVQGHCPYGLHLLTRKKHIQYINFLRDPVERAISYYYFIKDSDTKLYRPLYEIMPIQ